MGRAPCCDKTKVKRGPWSPEEDSTLKNYLEKYGTGGNWIALPHKAGLKRCGKSCRLRWLNYLRPDIKHGGFTEEEDNIILTLYSNIGSRWSVIASHLPGRTDNDVKNYWNTKLKKKMLAGATSLNPIPIKNTKSAHFTSIHPMDFSLAASVEPSYTVQSNYYANSTGSTVSSVTLPYQTDAINDYLEFVPEMLHESAQLPLPRLMEIQDNGASFNGFTTSSSQEISSLSPSYSLGSTYASWPNNGIGYQEGGLLAELGSKSCYGSLDCFDTHEGKFSSEEVDTSLVNYSNSNNLLANISDPKPSQGLH